MYLKLQSKKMTYYLFFLYISLFVTQLLFEGLYFGNTFNDRNIDIYSCVCKINRFLNHSKQNNQIFMFKSMLICSEESYLRGIKTVMIHCIVNLNDQHTIYFEKGI